MYDAHPTKVLKLCNSQLNEGKFAQLSENKNIVLLTKNPLGKKFQTTFMHSRVGIPIVPEKMHYVTRDEMMTHLRHRVDNMGGLGFSGAEVGTHSIRSSLAMALYLAKRPISTIMLLGRWSSDAFLLYIRR